MSVKNVSATEIKNQVKLELNIDKDTFEAAVKKVYQKNGKNITIPGFRKGKAPRAIIEKMYGKGVFYEDALNDILPAELEKAIEEAKLEVVSRPEIDVEKIDDEGVVVSALYYVKPEVELKAYKGLEAEKHGDKKISTYQEYARGFNMKSYDSMMGCNKANEARLKTPTEFEMRTVYDVAEFNDSLLHKILQSIYAAISEGDNAQKGLGHLKTTISDYWSKREMIKHLLARLIECKDIDYMPHWKECGEMAESIYILVDNDRI